MTQDEYELAQIARMTKQTVDMCFQQGYASGVALNINKGEKEAIRLGILSGLACLRGIEDALKEADGQIRHSFENLMDRFFQSDKPKVEVAPANLLNKNGKLIHN